ncbi:hypothetical protein DFH28DRAFT_978880 [Melampsora americana]|nr:hypothetical protein DFH28DRAFT_978880 [Melampsora americana]
MMNSFNQTTVMGNEENQSNSIIPNRSYLFQILISFTLISIQASLLHPYFVKSKLSKLIRRTLTPINFFLLISQPFRSSSRLPPESFDVFTRMTFASTSFIFASFALEFGFSNSVYYKRPLKKINGSLQWNQIKDQDDEFNDLKISQEEEEFKFSKLVFWTILNLTSFRGLQFTWGGPTEKANNQNLKQLIKRLIALSFTVLITLFIIFQTYHSPLKTPISSLNSIGIPNWFVINLISEWIYRVCIGVCLGSVMDFQFTFLTILLHFLYHFLIQFNHHLSIDFLELINPINYPPIFNFPHFSNSLFDLWSNRWHKILKRSVLNLGGKPTFWFFNQILGFNFQISRIAGLIGTFFAIGILHEYAIFALLYPTNPLNHLFDKSPNLLFYFLIQSIGILIENWIPKKFSKLFFWSFSIWTSQLFINRYLIDANLLDTCFG